MKPEKLTKAYSRMSDREISDAVNRHLLEYEPEAREFLLAEYAKRQQAPDKKSEAHPSIEVYAGQVYRFFAFCIDVILLCLVGYIIASAAQNLLCELTWEGRLIGIIVSLGYFAILESRINNGQTIGKMLMKIRVVNQNGAPQTFRQSLLRAFIFVVPYQLNGFPISANAFVSGSISVIVFAFVISQVYLAFFNNSNRQLVHDIFARTNVIKTGATLAAVVPIRKIHKTVCLAILCGVAGFMTIFALAFNVSTPKHMEELSSLQRSISGCEGVMWVSVNQNVTNGIYRSLFIDVRTMSYVSDYSRIVKDLSGLVIRTPGFEDEDIVVVNIGKYVDIGIARKSDKKKYSFNPAKLKEQLNAVTVPSRTSSSAHPR